MMKKFVLGGMVVVAALLGNACGDDASSDSPAGPADSEVTLSSSSDDVVLGNSSSSSVTESPSTSSGQAPQSVESDGSSSSEKAVGGSSSSGEKSSSSSGKVESSSSGKGEKSSSSEAAAGSSSSDVVAESSSSEKSSSSVAESSSSVESSSSEVPSSSSVVESSSGVAENSSSSENDVSSSSEYYKLNWDYLNPSISYDTIIDSRDGQVYKTVVIGSQIWMAENLNYNYPEGKKSICYHDSAEYCVRFGRLYKQDVLSLVCPEGWHVPDSTEWETLVIYTGETNGVLKTDTGWKVWNGDPTISNGTNDYGFSVHSSGYMYTSATGLTYCDVSMLELVARFWLKGVSKIISISERNSSRPGYYDSSSGAYHIRCLKDD